MNQMPFDESGGEHQGIPITLVPGGLSGWISWKPHAEVLSKDYRVVRVQLLNMASAEKKQEPAKGYSLRAESEALKNTLDTLRTARVNLVGWSHGGEVSLDFALNYPQRIRTLTLIEPAAYWVARAYGQFADDERSFRELLSGLHDPVSEEDLIKFLEMNGLVPPGTDPRSLSRWQVWNSLKISLKSIHTVLEHSDDIDRLQRLRNVPVLLVKGRDSVGSNSGIVDLLAKSLGSNAKVIVLPDGHACHIIAMDQFIAELRKHLSSS